MKWLEPKVECIEQRNGYNGILKQIERAGRTCYKSESNITDDSAQLFFDRLVKNGHLAMLEHGTVYLEYTSKKNGNKFTHKYTSNPYTRVREQPLNAKYEIDTTDWVYTKFYITTNMRVIVENGWEDDVKKYGCIEPSCFHYERHTFRITTDRAIANEIVRHRKDSYAQESTRWINYTKDKFGGITFTYPYWYEEDTLRGWLKRRVLNFAYKVSELSYKALIRLGCIAEQARVVLPLGLKTELVMTGFGDDLNDFVNKRLKGSTGKPHEDIRRIAEQISNKYYY